MTDRMTAAQLNEFRRSEGALGPTDGPKAPTRHRRDLEGPIHLAIRDYLIIALPNRAAFHHSPNELDMSGKKAELAVAKAKARGMRSGWPDFEIIHKGRAYFLEVKAPGGSLSDSQRECIEDLTIAGAEVAVVRSVDDVRSVLKFWGVI